MHRRFSALALAVALGTALATGCGSTNDSPGSDLKPIEPDGPRGAIDLAQDDDQISGTIRLTGLEPGSAHAVHLHGEAGGDFSCAGEKTPSHLVNFPDLLADEAGAAEISLNFAAPAGTLRSGTYVMVHENPRMAGEVATEAIVVTSAMEMNRAENPPIACGDITTE